MIDFRKGAVLSLLTIASSLSTAGCEWIILGVALDESDEEPCECCDDECDFPEPEPTLPPTVAIEIGDWPPIGPDRIVTVRASSDQGLNRADFLFSASYMGYFNAAGFGGDTATATGANLGEGFGRLEVTVVANDGSYTTSAVDDLLVDLTPPEAYFDQTVLPAAGADLTFWMADAWIVSGCELSVGDAIFTEELEPGYPSTLGVEWDFSLVSIPVDQIPLGNHAAQLRVWDAAGNLLVLDVPLTIDGLPPEVSILEPGEGDTVEDTFVVTASASDDMPFPVSIELRVGGALVATGNAPEASFVLSSLDFPVGETEISAVAVDQAGNESVISTRTVTIAGAEEAQP